VTGVQTCALPISICHFIFEQAKAKGLGITLPAARAPS
jgi:hypothetical protein